MSSDVSGELSALACLDRAALAARWSELFGVPAPPRCGATLLRLAIAWKLQMQAGSHSSLALRRSLRQPAIASLAPGTRLLREWQGRTHQVLVLPQGFEYDGRVFRSLSVIAREITGTNWSGPLFFGLRRGS